LSLSARTDRLIAALDGAGIELLLVTNLVNVRYLTGYTGSNGLALIGPQTRIFVTDFRYVEQAAAEVDPSYEQIKADQDLAVEIAELVPTGRPRIGFEEEHVSVGRHRKLTELLGDPAELVGVTGLVEQLRRVKDAEEIERIAAAAGIADAALLDVLDCGLIGRTERELMLKLEYGMRERGAVGPSFDSIVAAGPHGALPHAQPRDVPVREGDLVVFDWGAYAGGYCSDCTRTVAAGEPGPAAREAYELVLSAQLAALDAVRAGGDGREIDRVARDIIDGAGHGEHFGHGLGHGVGLEIHESPRLSLRSTDILETAEVVTVEPGVYIPGQFGIRIEDLVVVEPDGCRILTPLPMQLRIVD
jgi:Xaa-Pro aminopeptidase